MNTKCNGFTNWETWSVVNWFGDDGEFDGLDADGIEQEVRNHVDDYTDIQGSGLLSDIISGFMTNVNWYELEQHFTNEEEGEE